MRYARWIRCLLQSDWDIKSNRSKAAAVRDSVHPESRFGKNAITKDEESGSYKNGKGNGNEQIEASRVSKKTSNYGTIRMRGVVTAACPGEMAAQFAPFTQLEGA